MTTFLSQEFLGAIDDANIDEPDISAAELETRAIRYLSAIGQEFWGMPPEPNVADIYQRPNCTDSSTEYAQPGQVLRVTDPTATMPPFRITLQ